MSDNRIEGDAEDVGEVESDHEIGDEPLLARIPESVIPLGAGALFTATLLTLAGALFVGYSIATGRLYGFEPYELYLALLQFIIATVAQVTGVYFARQRVRWTWVMVAALLGSLAVITVPFTALAFVCIGLGKYHFMSYTPANIVRDT